MKKITFFLLLFALTSCYSTRLYVGSVDKKEPLTQVNKVWNHHLIGGLIPLENTKMKPADYVNNAENYVVKTNTSFLNYIVSGLTWGIYTPTQTEYYIPLKDMQK
ncbi:MAG: hypothetical protein R3Y38_02000 [Rikenellaceae bacterium]